MADKEYDEVYAELPDYPRGATLLEKVKWVVKEYQATVERANREAALAVRLRNALDKAVGPEEASKIV